MSSILLGPIRPGAAGEGGGKRAAGERVNKMRAKTYFVANDNLKRYCKMTREGGFEWYESNR
jgi:hypothetical protein